ncbi:ARM repeat superfamily protein [Artemisia annua]|uniref:ARM repeat superfamily protein n=1 Tax=Artemisia annua TaxID=35608 RepID=A0A2U1MM43_ARTAN|nr:ARM repeat superfamily protein [Artemisia annua]
MQVIGFLLFISKGPLSQRQNQMTKYDTIATCPADDNRVVAGFTSFWLCSRLSSPSLVSATIAPKAVAVNDDVCRSVAENGGALITRSSRLADDPSVIQEVMTIICTHCLRLPGNATSAIEAGAGDLAIQSMQKLH